MWLKGSSDVTLFLCREVWKPYKYYHRIKGGSIFTSLIKAKQNENNLHKRYFKQINR